MMQRERVLQLLRYHLANANRQCTDLKGDHSLKFLKRLWNFQKYYRIHLLESFIKVLAV